MADMLGVFAVEGERIWRGRVVDEEEEEKEGARGLRKCGFELRRRRGAVAAKLVASSGVARAHLT